MGLFGGPKQPADPRPYRVKIADWMEQTGCDPTHADAPKLDTLLDMEREGLIVRAEGAGQSPRWILTSLGYYEVTRQRHGGEPPWNGVF